MKSALLAVLSVCLLGLAACGYPKASGCQGLAVSDAWVREAPPSAAVQAAYFVLKNSGAKEVLVSAISSPDFERAEMHETVSADGSTRMQPVANVVLAPGAEVEFAPGGKHLMLFGPHQQYVQGDRVQLQFVCGAQREQLPINAAVRRAEPTAGHTH